MAGGWPCTWPGNYPGQVAARSNYVRSLYSFMDLIVRDRNSDKGELSLDSSFGMDMENIRCASKTVIVGVGEYKTSTHPGEVLVTYSLGSCLGVSAYDPKAQVGGLLHFMLPDSRINPAKAQEQPAMFADTGMAVFLNEMFTLGATRKNLSLKLAGASKVLKDGEFFDIGRRNLLMAKKLLWKNSLAVLAEETGGDVSRTVRLRMEDGKTTVKDAAGEHEL